MWQSNESDFPQRVFKASPIRNLLKFLIKRSFINWQMYMRSIYWQAMPKFQKKSDKQRQILDKVRKRDERATNEKKASKTCIEKSSMRSVDVHAANNNLDGTPYMSNRGELSCRNFVYTSSTWDYTTITIYFQRLKNMFFKFVGFVIHWLLGEVVNHLCFMDLSQPRVAQRCNVGLVKVYIGMYIDSNNTIFMTINQDVICIFSCKYWYNEMVWASVQIERHLR